MEGGGRVDRGKVGWMVYRCRLGELGNSLTGTGSSDPLETVGPTYSWGVGTSFFPTRCSFFYIYIYIYSIFSFHLLPLFLLLYFILAVSFPSFCWLRFECGMAFHTMCLTPER